MGEASQEQAVADIGRLRAMIGARAFASVAVNAEGELEPALRAEALADNQSTSVAPLRLSQSRSSR